MTSGRPSTPTTSNHAPLANGPGSPDTMGYTTLRGHGHEYQLFDNISNFRDVGAVINKECGYRIMKEGILYRSGMPDDASTRDKQRLDADFNLSTVIDLRSETEHKLASRRRHETLTEDDTNGSQDGSPPSAALVPNGDEHLLELDGVRRVMLSLAGRNLHKTLVWRLTWWNLGKFLTLFATGSRTEAIKLLAANVMQPRGLVGLAHDTLTSSTCEIKEILTYLSKPESYPTLIHCSQGKDRTGLVIVLLLLLLTNDSESEPKSNPESKQNIYTTTDTTTTAKIPLSTIQTDYFLSDPGLYAERDEWISELRNMGLGREFAECADGFVDAVKEFLEEGYGGVKGYLGAIGVDADVVEGIKGILLEGGGGERN